MTTEAQNRKAELAEMMARAGHLAAEEGYYSRGKTRELRVQSIAICRPEHWRWHPVGDSSLIRCGVCHPPACEHVVIQRVAA